MTKCELKKEIEKIKDKVEKMPIDNNPLEILLYLNTTQKDFLLQNIFPNIFTHLEQETLFECYEYITHFILIGIFRTPFINALETIQQILKNEIKRHEKQIKVLRTKLNISNMKVLNPRKDLKQETLYYISVDKTQVSHNEYKLLKELGRDE